MDDDVIAKAKRRFATLQLTRLAGLVLVMLGLTLWRTDMLISPPNPLAGKLLFAVGAFAMLIVPILLARQWRSLK